MHVLAELKSVLDNLVHAGSRLDAPALATWATKAVEEVPLERVHNVLEAVQALERALGGCDEPTPTKSPLGGDEDVPTDALPDANHASPLQAAVQEPQHACSDAGMVADAGMDAALVDPPPGAPEVVMGDVEAGADGDGAPTPGGVASAAVLSAVPIDELDQSDAETDEAAVLEGSVPPPRPIRVWGCVVQDGCCSLAVLPLLCCSGSDAAPSAGIVCLTVPCSARLQIPHLHISMWSCQPMHMPTPPLHCSTTQAQLWRSKWERRVWHCLLERALTTAPGCGAAALTVAALTDRLSSMLWRAEQRATLIKQIKAVCMSVFVLIILSVFMAVCVDVYFFMLTFRRSVVFRMTPLRHHRKRRQPSHSLPSRHKPSRHKSSRHKLSRLSKSGQGQRRCVDSGVQQT